MVEIELEDGYYLKSTDKAWTIGRQYKSKDKIKTVIIGYYTKLDNCLTAYYDISLRIKPADSMEKLLENSEHIKKFIEDKLRVLTIDLRMTV